jgi:hypothetical protein
METLDLTLFLDYFPEFEAAAIGEGQFTGLKLLSEKFLCFIPIDAEDPAYNYIQGLILAHILFLNINGGNPVTNVKSLESEMAFEIPKSPAGFTNFGQTQYGRMLEDLVNLNYLGGFSMSLLAVPYTSDCC